MTEPSIVLHTFALSHYCENVRWALDFKGVEYTEKSWAPMLHLARTWRLPKTYTPLLRVDGEILQESEAICDYLETRFPEPCLIPGDRRDAVRATADDARSIGPHVRRLVYLASVRDLPRLREVWATNVSALEARLHRIVFPVSRRMVFKGLRVNEEEGRKSEARVREFLDAQSARVAESRYLVGDAFTLADLTMAAILSPLARPPEHPFYGEHGLGEVMEELVESFRGYSALDWVRDCYAEHRRS
jgi:glutathione S-transferase